MVGRSLNGLPWVSVVVVTHDVDIAGQASRLIRLKDGKVIADEKVEEKVPVA